MQAMSPRLRRALLGWLVVFGVVAVLAFPAITAARAQTGQLPGDVAEGEQLYALRCARCHAADGSGAVMPGSGGREAPALAGRADVTVAYMDLVLRTGRMPPARDEPFDNRHRQAIFTAEQRQAIVAYTAQTFGLPGAIPEVPDGDPGAGLDLYATNCAACHGPTGAGGVAGAGAWTPAVTQYDATTVAEAIRVGPFQMPAFQADQLTDQEVGDIAAFLGEIAEEEGTLLGLSELNPVFLSAFAAVLALLMLGSLLWISGTPNWFPDPENEAAERDGATPSGHATGTAGRTIDTDAQEPS